MKKNLQKVVLALWLGLLSNYAIAQEFNSFEVRYSQNLRGDLTFIGNNILNRDSGTPGEGPLDPHNNLLNDNSWSGANNDLSGRTNYNDYKNMQNVDVDNSPQTFNSSSATFSFPVSDCNQIRYAALYWAATYPSATANGSYDGFTYIPNNIPIGTDRQSDFNQVKFRVPGAGYVDIAADEIIYDGFTSPDGNMRQNSPYACYADVTSIVASLANPEGEYTVANIRATTGGLTPGGGSSGGWTLIIVYENPTLTGKLITTFDGFARVNGTNSVDLQYSGFETIPAGPVKASLGAATLEGDYRIAGDALSIKADSNTNFTVVSNATNPGNNFFNSNITLNGAQLPGRDISNENTLGYDTDILLLNNPVNSVIPNGETGATLRFSTNGDQFFPFFNSFNIEVIEPNIVLEKRVEDIGGNDITGQGVNLGQLLDYVLNFRNYGNDNAVNYTIRDVLPINVTLDESSIVLPPGASYTFDPVTRTIVFSIPNELVEENDPEYTIRMRVKVAENCYDFIDACNNIIENLAYSTYYGEINTAQITDDPSVNAFNSCGYPTPGATNFILDEIEDCDFTFSARLCADSVTLDAGNNFDSYTWYEDVNNNRIVDGADVVINDGDPDGDPSTMIVSAVGTYIVYKQVADPCKDFNEIFLVEEYETGITNPITEIINQRNSDTDPRNDIVSEIVQCSVDGDPLPKIFLCGAGDSEFLQLNLPDTQNIVWQQLDEASCTSSGDDCANKNATCIWNDVSVGNSFLAASAGKFRLVITYENGCIGRFYFNVFQNLLDINFVKEDIVCTSPGNISVTNLGSSYGYQLIDAASGNILVPFSANNGSSFAITNNGAYIVEVAPLDTTTGQPIEGACVFETEPIGIIDRQMTVSVSTTAVNCNELGSVRLQANGVFPTYDYEIRLNDGATPQSGTLVDDELLQSDNNFTFYNLNAGDYHAIIRSIDGCEETLPFSIQRVPDLGLFAQTTKEISCTPGTIELSATGGFPNPEYAYAIWSINGTNLYTSINDIPAVEFQSNAVFEFNTGEEGSYTFVVVDGNNCFEISNTAIISLLPPLVMTVDSNPIECSGTDTASITLTTSNGTSPFEYSIDGGVTFQTTNTFVNLSSGDYSLLVRDSEGCEVNQPFTISEPDLLRASAVISEVEDCNPSLGAEVMVINARGGVAPYEYSFDGGASYVSSNVSYLPSGTHTIIVRDQSGCTYPMELIIPAALPEPSFTSTVEYNCLGEGMVTVNSSSTDFDYTYLLNGIPNTPADQNVFTPVPAGTHTITVNYELNTPGIQNSLISETFGAGANTSISEIDPVYCYEPQDGSTRACEPERPFEINDGEYSVTNDIVRPFPVWRAPNDHTGDPEGRFLAINVGGVAGINGVIYAKRGVEVLPNNDIIISLWAFNIMADGNPGFGDPSIVVELVDGAGNVITSLDTGFVPKNTHPDDWYNYTFTLNPGANTSLDIVMRTNSNVIMGNDIAIDDIQAFQLPTTCPKSQEITVIVEPNQALEASIISATDPTCAGASDGGFTFEVSPFDTAGFDYSIDGGITWINQTTSPTTTSNTLSAGVYSVSVRKTSDPSCVVSFDVTLNDPTPLTVSGNVTTNYTCTNGGAIIIANTTGGTPQYQYQLEDDSGGIISGYDFATNGSNSVFSGIAPGDYYIRVRDLQACEATTTVAIVVDSPNVLAFDAATTGCYSGNNDGSILVSVTSGNGGYSFRIDGGLWRQPTPSSDTTYTFQNLASGTHTVEVMDSYGCIAAPQPIEIYPLLFADVEVTPVSSCADGTIVVTATGGDGNYSYAIVPSGTDPSGSFSTSNSLNISIGNEGDYDVYVRDHNNNTGYCEYLEAVTVPLAPSLVISATAIHPQCHDFNGSIELNISSGDGLFDVALVDNTHGGTFNQNRTGIVNTSQTFYNLLSGNYTLNVTDRYGCVESQNVTIINPEELTGEVIGITPSSCTGDVNDFGFQFTSYPTTLGVIEFSADGGLTWIGDNSVPGTSDRFTGYLSGTDVYPAMRTVDAMGNTLCFTRLDPFIVPFPLDDLDISISAIVVDCNELQVTVLGAEGTPNYQYTYSEDPASFDPVSPIHPWTTPALDEFTPYVFNGLVPGRTYVFYVRDAAGCVRQSNINVNDLITVPLQITSEWTPACPGDSNGTITYTVTDNESPFGNEISWILYEKSGGVVTPIDNSGGPVPYSSPQDVVVTGLAAGTYFIEVQEYDGGVPTCIGATENLVINEVLPLSGTLSVSQDIACNAPGLLHIDNLTGGAGNFVFDVSGPAGFTPIIGTTDNPIEIPANSPAGNYSVTVRDEVSCTLSLGPTTINQTTPPSIDLISVSNCTSPPSINITASASTAQILYSIDGGITFEDNGGLFSPVSPGIYNIVVIDSNGCTATSTTTVYPVLEADVQITKYLDCTPTPDAEVQIEVFRGSGDYEYEVTNSGGPIIGRTVMPSNPFTFNLNTADTYTVTVYDSNTTLNCSRVFTIEIPAAVDPIFNETPQDVSCFGASDGRIYIEEINIGINPLTFAISPAVGNFNPSGLFFENLPAGVYSITATGTNGCFSTINGINIGEPTPINIPTPTVVEYTCAVSNQSNNASISVSGITGGSGSYTNYQFYRNGTLVQSGTNDTYTEGDGLGGNYTIVVFDDTNCSEMVTGTILPFDELQSINLTADPISCINGGETVTLEATSSLTNSVSNPSNYEFRQLPSGVFSTSNSFSGLTPGTYVFEVRNVTTNCIMNITHVVESPINFTAEVTKNYDAPCYGDLGSVTLDIASTSYTAGYDWAIYNTNGTLNDITDDGAPVAVGTSPDTNPTAAIAIPAGNYRATFRQSAFPSCEQTLFFSINSPVNPLSVNISEQSSVSCDNSSGVLLVQAEGGTAPYTISLENTTTAFSETISNVSGYVFENLSSGNYTVTVEDANNCYQVFNSVVSLDMPQPITANITSPYIFNCPDELNGFIEITNLTGGLGTIQYILNRYDGAGGTLLSTSSAQSSPVFSNLTVGYYGIQIVDEGNCGIELFTEISNPEEVIASLVKSASLTCSTLGEIVLSGTGGTAPYEYSEDGVSFFSMNNNAGPNTHVFDNIGPGNYRYYVRDANGCISRLSNEITENPIPPLTLTVDASRAVVNCSGEASATIIAQATGGLGNYEYELYTEANLNPASRIAGPQANGTFNNLTSGTYYVSVNSEDCTTAPQQVIIADPVPLSITVDQQDILCHGDTNGSISVTLSGGAGGYQYAISPNLNQFDSINTFDELAAGNYTIIAQDQLGCFEQIEITITEPLELNVEAVVIDESCLNENDGSISLNITGGTAPYFTDLLSDDISLIENELSYTNLNAGNHQIRVIDANGCDSVINYTIGVGVDLSAAVVVDYNCDNNSPGNNVVVTLNQPELSGEVLYALDSSDPNDMQLSSSFENLSEGTHFISIAHTNGCINNVSFEVAAIAPLRLTIENNLLNQITATATGGFGGYTFFFNEVDNGDDNTYFIDQSGIYTVTVVDDKGCTATASLEMEFVDIQIPDVFTPDGDGLNDLWAPENIQGFPEVLVLIFDRYGRELYRMTNYDLPWDGTYLSDHLPTGDYWYLIKIRGEQDTREVVGHFTLYR